MEEEESRAGRQARRNYYSYSGGAWQFGLGIVQTKDRSQRWPQRFLDIVYEENGRIKGALKFLS